MLKKIIIFSISYTITLISAYRTSPLTLLKATRHIKHATLPAIHNASTHTAAVDNQVEIFRQAIQKNDIDAIKKLLQEKKVNIHMRDAYGDTLLHIALENREISFCIVEEIIRAGGDINAINSLGNTPLHYAYYFKNNAAVDVLLQQGARSDTPNSFGDIPKQYAIKNKRDVVDRAISTPVLYGDKISIDQANKAIEENWYPAFQELLKEHPRLAMRIYGGNRTALHRITRLYTISSEFISILVEAGVDVNAQDTWGRTALHNAAHFGSPHGVETLLKLGANPNCVDMFKKSPLYYAQETHAPSYNMLKVISLLEKVTDESLWLRKTPEHIIIEKTERIEELWLNMTRGYHYYELLGVPLNSSPEEINDAFNRFMKTYYGLKTKNNELAKKIDELVFYVLRHIRS